MQSDIRLAPPLTVFVYIMMTIFPFLLLCFAAGVTLVDYLL